MRWRFQGLWHNSNFTKLWSSHTISNIGNGITGIALPLTAILVLSASPVQIGILSALDGLAVLLFGLLAGVLVDRIRRRSILIVTDIGRVLLLASIPVCGLKVSLALFGREFGTDHSGPLLFEGVPNLSSDFPGEPEAQSVSI